MEKRRQPEIIAGRVNNDGTIAAGDGFTVVRASVGVYNVTVTLPGFRLVSFTATVHSGTHIAWGNAVAPGERTFSVQTMTIGGVATDSIWGFIAVGVQT
jgi:hypothetical protein